MVLIVREVQQQNSLEQAADNADPVGLHSPSHALQPALETRQCRLDIGLKLIKVVLQVVKSIMVQICVPATQSIRLATRNPRSLGILLLVYGA